MLYTLGLYVGTPVEKPDYPGHDRRRSDGRRLTRRSSTGCRCPSVGDELHHFGWNACSSCHGDAETFRRFLVVPGLRSSRIHIVDAADPRAPKLHKVIEPRDDHRQGEAHARRTRSTACPTGEIMISMLGDAQGKAPGGFLLLDDKFEIAGRWEHNAQAA